MIVTKHGFKKRYVYGGSGIFDTITNLLARIFTSSAAKQIASSALDVGKSVAKEGAKKALDVSSVYMGILGQAFPPIFPIFPHFSKLGPLFKKTLKILKNAYL